MFKHGFPPEWSTFKKLIWLVGTGIAGAAAGVWKTVTGTLLHITDALASPMQKCEVTLEPIQDLHGQDAPYPAGGGINKLEPNTFPETTQYGVKYTTNADGSISMIGTVTNTTWNSNSKTIPLSHYGLSAGDTVSVLISGVNTMLVARFFNGSTLLNANIIAENITQSFGTGVGSGIVPNDATNIQLLVYCKASAPPTVGETVDKTVYPLISFGSTAPSEWSPYSNICPITGWTGCEVTRLGANILPYPYFDSSVTKSGITFTVNDDYTVTVNGTASNDATFELCRTYPYSNDEFVLDKMITLTGCPQNGSQSTYYLSAVITGHKDIGSGVSFKMTNAGYFRFSIVIKSGVTVNNLIFKPMVVVGTEQQDYEPYSGTTLSVTFPDGQTVYGGKYEFVSGGLKPYKEYDSYNGETLTGEWMSSMDKYVAGTTPTIGAQVVDLDGYDTTVQLTPQEISTLKGENNVWSNGDTTIIYKAQAS